ncbi:MAG: RsmD family RNA methyltransferase, partial [Acidobacteriia bacterium]|nr:RsmD family RNA methyltransferase [Terriglobia bacterium]
MRIISGTYRSLTIKALKGGKLRPTSEQLRETLFDVLGPSVEGSVFLDAY